LTRLDFARLVRRVRKHGFAILFFKVKPQWKKEVFRRDRFQLEEEEECWTMIRKLCN